MTTGRLAMRVAIVAMGLSVGLLVILNLLMTLQVIYERFASLQP